MNIYEKIAGLISGKETFSVATITETSGSTPGKQGFKIVVTKKGDVFGTVGGGLLEKEIIGECANSIKSGRSFVKKYLLCENEIQQEGAVLLNMSCNGKASVFFEFFNPPDKIYLFGGGHIGQAFLKIIKELNYTVTLIDNRAEFANANVNPDADEIVCADYGEFFRTFKPVENCYILIATHSHDTDFDILRNCVKFSGQIKYIGVVASKSKAASFKEKLASEFGTEAERMKINMPVGLNIGGNAPAEIALSIAAEIQAVKYGKQII